jgi:hypothetical protein
MARALRALSLGLAACALAACAPRLPEGPTRGGEPRLSLLALGDWGRRPQEGATPPKQFRVGQELAAEDRRAPADALVFLGDNFYPHGLLEHELEMRLRVNLAAPYCRFVRLTELGQRALGAACAEPESLRRPIPMWAVLGNHDHNTGEAVELERARIPEYVSNWRLFAFPVETLELPQGVSLIFYDSTLLRMPARASQLDLLTRALRESAGPWRIVVAHHPLDGRGMSLPIEAALGAARVPAQLQLVGHVHDLRANAPAAPLPALQVVSGGGGGSESRATQLPEQLFKLTSPGFARIELMRDTAGEYLRVRLFAVDEDEPGARVVAAWSITREGDVSAETLR